ncbi:MAG: hypothetical protein AAF688_08470 [Bacteroidota bacterium]
MKTKFLLALLVLMSSIRMLAQNQQNKYVEASKSLQKNFLQMLENPNPLAIDKKKDVADCEPFPILEQFTKSDLLPKRKPFEDYLKNILLEYNKKLNALKDNIVLKTSSDPNSSYLAAVNRSSRFKDFAEDITGAKIFNINKNDKNILLDFYLNHPLKKPTAIVSKGEKVATAEFSECYATTEHTLTISKWKYPKVTWAIESTVTITCDCVEDSNIQDEVNEAVLTYDAFIKGELSGTKITFGKTEASSLTLDSVSCCPVGEEPIEEAGIQLEPTETISLPNQTIGFRGGIGLEQDFEEIALCLGAEYLYNITDVGNSPLFIGANAQFSNTSFMDFSSTWVSVGPTAQLFSPINQAGDLHITNGINGGYVFGTNDNNGFKDDVSGFEISLNTGLNIQIKDNLAISLIIPVVSHQSLTLEAQEGAGSQDISNISILLNKENPIKLGLRFDF